MRIAGGTFIITSDKDGIHSENKDDASLGFIYIENGSFNVTAEGDGFDAVGNLQINNGDFTITTGGGSQNPIPKTFDSPSAKVLKSNSDVSIHGGTFNIDSFDDSIHANRDVTITNGDFTLLTEDDAIHADANLSITDGNITIIDSYEGLEGLTVDIMGGNINITALDDGINAIGEIGEECYVHISGGLINIHSTGVWGGWSAQGGDAIDANGDLLVTDGEIYISGTTSHRDGALDFDYHEAIITGGTIVATGDHSMAQNFADTSTQGSILVPSQNKQTDAVKLQDSKGNNLLSFTPKNEYNSVLISTPDIKQGETYTIIMGSESQTVKMKNIIFGESQMRGLRGHR